MLLISVLGWDFPLLNCTRGATGNGMPNCRCGCASTWVQISRSCSTDRRGFFLLARMRSGGGWKGDGEVWVRLGEHVGPDIPLMFDGSAGFDLADAIALGRVLHEANYLLDEKPLRAITVTAYKLLSRRVNIPLLVAETSDGAHMNSADFIAAGAATAVRTGTTYRGGLTGALRTAHLADSFLMRAEVHGGGLANRHLCMAIPNTTYYESLVTTSSPVVRAPEVDARGMVRAPEGPGMGWEGVWAAEGVPPELAARAW